MSIATSRALSIAHVGALDLASYGDQLYPLVAAAELRRRLDDTEVLPFGPVGADGLTWALGPWSERRAAALAARSHVVLCGGGEAVTGDGGLFGPFYGLDARDADDLGIDRWFIEGLAQSEATTPMVWHGLGVPDDLDPETAARVRQATASRALVAVRDEVSRRRLEAAGVEQAIKVVPDSALLLPRVLTPAALEAERAHLQRCGILPTHGKVLVVQGNHTMTPWAESIAAGLEVLAPEVHVVTVANSPCHADDLFADALRKHLTRPSWGLPASASVEAIAATIAMADCFLGVSLHGAITAVAYGRPFVTLDLFDQAKLSGFVDLVGAVDSISQDPLEAVKLAMHRTATTDDPAVLAGLQRRIDEHFDAVAELVTMAAANRTTPVEPVTWADTAAPLHLRLRRPPRPARPAPVTDIAGLRRPDATPTLEELSAAVDQALRLRLGRRDGDTTDEIDLRRLRDENSELRGALTHLEGVVAQAELLRSELDSTHVRLAVAEAHRQQLEQIVTTARNSRAFRLTRFPRVLRDQ